MKNYDKFILCNKMVKRALLIGINYNSYPNLKLNGCINDVNNIKNVLSTIYKINDIRMMTDDTEIKPTKDNIIKEFIKIIQESTPGDTIFFHYSGHGTAIRDYSGDERFGFDSALVPLDCMQSGLITDDYIRLHILSKVVKGVRLIGLLDCCNNGTGFDLKYLYNDYSNNVSTNLGLINYTNSIKMLRQIIYDSPKYPISEGDIMMISGSRDNQYATDAFINGSSQGAFTFAFLNILQKTNYRISWRNLLKEIRLFLLNLNFTQIPQLTSGKLFLIDSFFNI